MTTASELEHSVADMIMSLRNEGHPTACLLVLMNESNYLLVEDPEAIIDSKLCGIPIAFNNQIPIGLMCLAQFQDIGTKNFSPMESKTSFEVSNNYGSFIDDFWKKILNRKE